MLRMFSRNLTKKARTARQRNSFMGEALEDRRLMTAVPGDLNPGDPYYLAFVTSQQTIGFFPTPGPAGGTAAADAFVDSLACTATLNDSSCSIDYQAIISDGTQDANNGLGLAAGIPIYNTNLDRIANDVSDLWDGTIQNPIIFDENGISVSDIRPEVWTGTRFNGVDSGVNGGNWSGLDYATHGIAWATNASWIENEPQFHTDGDKLRVYGISDPLRVPEEPGDDASIHGQKWHDLNGDGIRDPNEPGLNGWTIVVIDPATGNPALDANGNPITQVTHSMDLDGDGVIDPIKEQGLYWIEGVPAGTYYVDELDQPGWMQTSPSPTVEVNGYALADNFFQAFEGDTAGTSVTSIGPVVNGPQPQAGRSILNGTTTLGGNHVTSEDYLYMTAWSDDGIVQGLMMDLTIDGNQVLSGDSAWQVHATGIDLDSLTGPTTASLSSEIATATWGPTTNGPLNSAGLYGVLGTIANIDNNAEWTWFDTGNQSTAQAPFRNGFNHDEYLVFRVPTGAGRHLVTVKPGDVLHHVDFGNKGTGSIHGNKFVARRNVSLMCGDSVEDRFAAPQEATNHSPGLDAFFANNSISATNQFDDRQFNENFGCSFENLPSNIVAAELEFAAAPLDIGANDNDTVHVGLHDSGGAPINIWGARFDDPALPAISLLNHPSGNGWIPANYPYEVFNLDLGNLPPMTGTTTNLLPDMNTHGFLDMRIQDDTIVDYARLDLTVGTGAAGWVIEAVDANGNVVATATTMVDDPTTLEDETGMFWLENLAPGTYTIQEQQQPGWNLASPSAGSYTITVGPGGTVDDVNFVNEKLGSVHGQKLHKVRRQLRRTLGANDNYALPADATNPSTALQNFITTNGLSTKGYDSTTINRSFADSFQGLPTGVTVTGATVRVHMKPGNSSLSRNDTISFGHMDPAYAGTGSPWRQVAGNAVAQGFHIGSGYTNSLLPSQWNTTNYGDTALTVSITNNDVLGAIGTYGLLDVYVQDDTTVDYMEICLHYETLEGLNNWTINLTDAVGNVADTQVTHNMDLNGDGVIDPQTERGLYWFEDVVPGTYDVSEVMKPWWTAVSPVGGTQSVTVQPGQTLEHVDFINRRRFTIHHLPCFFKFEPVGPVVPGLGEVTVVDFDGLEGDIRPDQFVESDGISLSGARRIGIYPEGVGNIPQLDGYDGRVDGNSDASHVDGDAVMRVDLDNENQGFEISFNEPVSYVGGLLAVPVREGEQVPRPQIQAFDDAGNLLNEVRVELQVHEDQEAAEANWAIRGNADNISSVRISANTSHVIFDDMSYLRADQVSNGLAGDAARVDRFMVGQQQAIQTINFGGSQPGDFAPFVIGGGSTEIPGDYFAGEFGLTIQGLADQQLLLTTEGESGIGNLDGYDGSYQNDGDQVLALLPVTTTEPSGETCELGHDNDCDDLESTGAGVQLDFNPPVSAAGGLVAFLEGDPDRPLILGRVQAFDSEGQLITQLNAETRLNLDHDATEGFWQIDAGGQEVISSIRIEPLDENNQASHDTGLVLDSLSFTRTSVPVIPPAIKGIEVGSSQWTASFLDALGGSGRGYAIPQGQAQLDPLPWRNVDRILVELSEDVGIVRDEDVQVVGVNGSYSHSVDYDSDSRIATINLDQPVGLDKVLVVLNDSIQDLSGHQLDGEWQNGQTGNSGDGNQGGPFAFQINVVPGDINQSGATAVSDLGGLRTSLGSRTTDDRYSIFADTNGSGGVSVNDARPLREHLGGALPVEDPQIPNAPLAAVGVSNDIDAVIDLIHGFDRDEVFADDEDMFDVIAKSKRRAFIA